MSDSKQPSMNAFTQIEVPEGTSVRRVERFEYTTPTHLYDIELFEEQDGTFYAIGIPRADKVVVFGSNRVPRAEQALQTVIDKIQREQLP